MTPTRHTSRPQISFEFFPPKTNTMRQQLWHALDHLADLEPRFVSITYGAGGSTRDYTHKAVIDIQDKYDLPVAAHLTCVAASKEQVNQIARHYWQSGVRHIVALRGDDFEGTNPQPDWGQDYHYASDMVTGLKGMSDFEISVAAYPETHPQAQSPEADIDNLKRKFDAGASRAITQYFFETDDYFRFLDKVRAAGIEGEIVPGILPVTNIETVQRFSKKCGIKIPAWLVTMFDGLDNDPETRQLVAASIAIEQCRRLQAQGVSQFHFYTLNRGQLTRAICHALGARANGLHELARTCHG